jgi:hypothetical protein
LAATAAHSGRLARSDVSVVLLTLGEPTTARALESVHRQTERPASVVVVEGVSPWTDALQRGVSAVRTPFLLQVDADMILDPTCLEALRGAMTPSVGIVGGKLRDPLVGSLPAVKLFRRECFEAEPLRPSISPDSDFYERIGLRGWATIYLLSYGGPATPHTFGEHAPAYTYQYTFATFFLLGCRFSHRAYAAGLAWRLRQLRDSTHPMAPIARLALAKGLFAALTGLVSKSSIRADEAVLAAVAQAEPDGSAPPLTPDGCADPEDLCREFYERGRALGRASAYATFRAWLCVLAAPVPCSWIAEAGLCQGFLHGVEGLRATDRLWERLRRLDAEPVTVA